VAREAQRGHAGLGAQGGSPRESGVAEANGIEITWESFGKDDAEPMLLIMGLGTQMLDWPDAFCELPAGRGFRVIRFDNRDSGLSTHLDDAARPNVSAAMAGDASSATYTLDDMANDSAGLLDALGIERAHVVGASMGGMIAQLLALRYPERVLSLCSIMSTTGERAVGQPLEAGLAVLFTPPPAERDAYADYYVQMARGIGSPRYPAEEDELRRRAVELRDRAFDPTGIGRQLVAILASPDRTERLRELRVPTLVIHGEDDPLVTVSGGYATARAVPDAELVVIEGMGHDLPRQLWPRLADAIASNATRAGEQ
jgi:pimeloyl-ACP methyl ester carboxylesterase